MNQKTEPTCTHRYFTKRIHKLKTNSETDYINQQTKFIIYIRRYSIKRIRKPKLTKWTDTHRINIFVVIQSSEYTNKNLTS